MRQLRLDLDGAEAGRHRIDRATPTGQPCWACGQPATSVTTEGHLCTLCSCWLQPQDSPQSKDAVLNGHRLPWMRKTA